MKLATILARLALGASAILGAQAPADAAPQTSKDGTFSHTDHVPRSWLHWDPAKGVRENPRDCRGCHDYSPDPDRRPPPAQLCDRCHGFQKPTFEGARLVDPEVEDWSRDRDAGLERFNHIEHRKADCAQCHFPTGETDIPATLPKSSLESAAACGTCHGPNGDARHVRDRFDAGIDARLAKRKATEFGAFRHDQHIRPEELASRDPAVCQRCHFNVKQADQETLVDKQFSVSVCKTCHEGGRFETDSYDKPSRTVATFLHKQHLSEAALSADPELKARGCLACHAYDPSRRTFDLGPLFRSGPGAADLHAYAGCITCHADKKVERHGSIDDCRKCHDFDSRGLGGLVEVWKQRRARLEVTRTGPAAFSFGSQAHELITGALNDACQSCHKARIPTLPSRLKDRPFRHDTHLAQGASQDRGECRRCHASMAEAEGPADIVLSADAGAGRAFYELSHCKACHHSTDLEVEPGASESRSVLRFSHSEHLDRKLPGSDQPMECLNCHVEKGERVELQPAVNECSKCHDHDQPRSTAGHSRAAIESCRTCHTRGVPEHGEPAPVPRLRLARLEGRRTHPRAPDKECSECHHYSGSEEPRPVGRIEYRMADMESVTPHASPLHASIEKHFQANPVGERKTWCIDCHWGSFDAIAGERDLLKQQVWFQEHPQEPAWRREYGDRMDAGFPGIPPPADRP